MTNKTPMVDHVDPMTELTMPRRWAQVDNLDSYHQSGEVNVPQFRKRARRGNLRFVDEGEGNLVTSMVELNVQRPILDLDFPHRYEPSSTPGHGHLYLNNTAMSDGTYLTFLTILVEFGVISTASVDQFRAHAMSMVRAPGVFKPGYEREHVTMERFEELRREQARLLAEVHRYHDTFPYNCKCTWCKEGRVMEVDQDAE